MSESADVVEKSKPAQSTQSAGPVTRKGARNEPLPEELLAILVDHLIHIRNSGIDVELIPTLYRDGRKCTGFLVMDCELIEGRIRRIQEPEK